ncbi:MAG: endonuclease/exonuclease/phosphatase family protein [Luteolibacter sp.]
MSFRSFLTSIQNSAPRFLGAVFCSANLLASTSCGKKNSTPEWETAAAKTQPAEAAPAPKPEGAKPASAAHKSADAKPAAKTTAPTTEGLRFMTYNVENWLTMDRYVDGKNLKGAPKPKKEKQAVVSILARHQPDVLGLCEVGEASDLAEIQEKLKQAGLNLPHRHYTGGTDPTRHLGILSRFPITSTAKPAETEYQLDGKTYGINRGILDATIDARGKSYRFIGVHLKSKRDSEQGDQEAIRLHEARLLRRHLDSIFKASNDARLVVYGDFNDTRSTPAIKAVTGNYNDPTYLTAIPAKDSHGEAWTHFWALNDIYSRIDFVMVSPALKREVSFPAAKVIDDTDWNDASDHRSVLAEFK